MLYFHKINLYYNFFSRFFILKRLNKLRKKDYYKNKNKNKNMVLNIEYKKKNFKRKYEQFSSSK